MHKIFFEGVLHGRFGQWGVPQFRLWRTWFARYRHIGFEVEFFHQNRMTAYELRDTIGSHRFTWWEKYSARGQAEVQFLTKLDQHPRKWREQMLSEMTILRAAGVSFEGGIHANLQMTRTIGEVGPDFSHRLESKTIVPGILGNKPIYRWENKYLAGVILQEDLILQAILYIYYVQNRYDNGEILLQKMFKAYETALSTYSKDQLVFHRDLREVIELWVKPYFIGHET